jgi:Undecaprenyl-phosphate galactose phosphotransferase WbaP
MSAATPQLAYPIHIEAPSGRPKHMVLSLMASDCASLIAAVAVSVLCKAMLGDLVDLYSYLRLAVFLPAFLVAYAAVGLYSGVGLIPPEELRRCTLCSAVVFVALSTLTVSLRGASTYVTSTLVLALALSVFFVPLFRAALRCLCADRKWWGYPAVIFGTHASASKVIEVLKRNPAFALKPIAIVDEKMGVRSHCGALPVLRSSDILSSSLPVGTYAVLTGDASTEAVRALGSFSRVLVLPELLPGVPNVLVAPKVMGNFLALEMRQQVLVLPNQLMKRTLDLALVILASPVVLPLLIAIATCIRIDSSGPVFYSQTRIGRRGREFRAWKFRSMRVNADQVLHRHLAQDPELQREWEECHKLKNDPRVTQVGAFLRKTSLDELPQLWNVVRGEMSLVGPRPIVHAEIIRYAGDFDSYTKVPGGITGLWQVSGRSDTSYVERVALDEYYVRNWSVWLDMYILCRTISTVLLRKGSY